MQINELIERYKQGESDFSGQELRNANLSGLDLKGINLSKSDLTDANLSNADLTGADLSNALLIRCWMEGAILKNTNLMGANLTAANIRKVIIENTDFRNTNLMYAHLCGNSLLRAKLEGAHMDWSCLVDSELSDQQKGIVPPHALTGSGSQHETYKGIESSIGPGYAMLPSEAIGAGYKGSGGVVGEGYKGSSPLDDKKKKDWC